MADEDTALAAATVITADSTVDYVLDKDLRTVAIPSRGVVLGVEGDNDTNRVRFECPQVYKGTDLSEFTATVVYVNAGAEAGRYTVTDLTASDGTLSFTWLVAALAVRYEGNVTFAVKFAKDDLAYNSTIATATCLQGIDGTALADVDAESLLSQLLAAQTAANDAATAANAAASNADAATEAAKTATDAANTATSNADAATANANAATESAKSTESDIEAAEAGRVTAEEARVSAETSRAEAEAARADAESSRETAERARADAETARTSAEADRATAESARASAETARAEAESSRVTAETAREAASADAVQRVDDALSRVVSFDAKVVDSLPDAGETGIIYLVAHAHGDGDSYDEHIWTGSGYEKIGSTDVDLSGYQAKLTAGDGISISGNTISVSYPDADSTSY